MLLLWHYLPCSDAPATNCHVEEGTRGGTVEKQAQTGGYKMEAYLHLLSAFFKSTKAEKYSLSELTTDFIYIYVSVYTYIHTHISDLAERKNTFVHAQASIHQIHLLY